MASVWGELRRRNVVKVAVAYAIVGWLLVEITSTVLPTFEAPLWVLQTITFVIILGFPLALILSWAYEITPEGIKLERNVAAGKSITKVTGRKFDLVIIGLLVLAVGFMFVDNYLPESGPFAGADIDPASLDIVLDEPPSIGVELAPAIAEEDQREVLPNSVAVLLCANLSPDPDDAYFAASIHEEILNQLYKIRALNVIARTSVLQYADAPPPISQIAEELNVGAVMECSVRYAGDAILVTAQLIDPETNIHLWSDTYPGDMSDLSTIFAMQADIAMNIANAVGAEFSPEEQASIEKIPTESTEAYALYLKALGSPLNEVMATYLDQAIELDPDFALAHAMKAFNYTFALIGVGGGNPDQVAALEPIVRDSAERALALDSSLGLAHAALADVHMVNWRGAEAEQAFQRAQQLSPDADVLMAYGRFKRYRGEHGESIPLLQRAVELDPNNFIRYNQLGIAYTRTRAYDAAAIALGTAVELSPTNVGSLTNLALTEVARGNYDDAVRRIEIVERLNPGTGRFAQMALAYSQMGRDEDARRMFLKFEESAAENPVGDAWWARAYLAVGDYEQALQRLETAVEERELTDLASLSSLAANPWGDPILDEPDFQELLSGLWDDK